MKNYTDQEIADFKLENHLHVQEELTLTVNPFGKLSIDTIGGLLEPTSSAYSPKVITSVEILGLTPEDYRDMAKFLNQVADRLDALETGP